LAQLTNKCGDDDVNYYVQQCGAVLPDVANNVNDSTNAKEILHYVFKELIKFKNSQE